MIRVLIVDDSAFARKVLRETLVEAAGFEVVGFARDGFEALELIAMQKPDVMTLDLMMPNLDGLGVLHELKQMPSPPRVVVVTTTGSNTKLGIEALAAGAFDLVQKPTAQPTDMLYDLASELKEKLHAAAASTRRRPAIAPKPAPLAPLQTRRSIVVVGASTGGPPALSTLLATLPSNMPVPVAMVLHIPPGYTEALAARYDDGSHLTVVESSDGMRLEAGMAVLARAGFHLRLSWRDEAWWGSAHEQPTSSPHRPSVDELFKSVASQRDKVIGVVLTGMGDDGLEGSRAIHKAGGTLLTESAESCVVYGMPRAVHEAGLATAEAPIERMAQLIVEHL